MVKYQTELLDKTFSALSDPHRREMLVLLSQKSYSVTEVATCFEISLPAVSKHLKVLEEAKLISRQKKGRYHRFRVLEQNMKTAEQWLEQYREFWNANLDSFAKYLELTNRKDKSERT